MELREVQKRIRDLVVGRPGSYSVSFSGSCAAVYRENELLVAGHVLDVLQELRKETKA